LAAPGLLLRAWAAGCILKERVLATGGPYRLIRNPLFVGSFLLGLGGVVAGGSWPFLVVFLLFFGWTYSRTLEAEERTLEDTFGEAYREYRASVPAFVPRLAREVDSRASTPGPGSGGFRWNLYLRNREWQAGLGTMLAFGFLVAKWALQSR
jgi:hypothetical protein